jgi:hypothetical protein
VSHDSRGEHDINKPISFGIHNTRIAIHDSPGFETGEKADQSRYDEVIKFIKSRQKAVNLADQLHCIW